MLWADLAFISTLIAGGYVWVRLEKLLEELEDNPMNETIKPSAVTIVKQFPYTSSQPELMGENFDISPNTAIQIERVLPEKESSHFGVVLGGDFKGWGNGNKIAYLYDEHWALDVPTVELSTSTEHINNAGVEVLKAFEGLELNQYFCCGGVSTVGYGTTRIDGNPIPVGKQITAAEAEALLKKDLVTYEQGVARIAKVPLSPDQFSALVVFAYNIGLGALEYDCTAMTRVNTREPNAAVAEAWGWWNKAGGKVSAGLERRRNAEIALFTGKDYRKFL